MIITHLHHRRKTALHLQLTKHQRQKAANHRLPRVKQAILVHLKQAATRSILCWTPDDVNPMLEMWKGDTGYTDDQINFVNFSVGGGEAAAQYDQYFLGGDDVDLFMVEADWALKYINDDSATAPMSELGFKDEDFAGQYAYTMDIGKDSNGVIKGISWQAAPGGWCYRTDLAETVPRS